MKEKRAVKIAPPCENDPCAFFRKTEWSREGPKWGTRWHCDHPDHPDNPRARPDEKCPKLILSAKNGGKNMNMESKKKDIEDYSGDWLSKYDDLEQRLELAKRILNKYPPYVPPFNRSAQPLETVEILLSDIQEFHVLVDLNRPPLRSEI